MSDSSSSSPQWRIRGGGQERAIGSFDELKQLVATGAVRPEWYIYHPQKQQWMYASQLPELRASFSQAAHDPNAWIVNLGDGRTETFRELSELQQWVVESKIERTTKVRNPVLGRWMAAADIPELKPSFARQAPRIIYDTPSTEPPRSFANAILVGVIAAAIALGALAFLTHKTRRPVKKITPVALPAETATAPDEAPRPKPTIHTIYGKDGPPKAASGATGPTGPTGETAAATATAPPPPAAPAPTTTVAPLEQPKRVVDEAEDVDNDEDVAVRGNDAIRVVPSGDTMVVIDRSGRDPYYHVPGCPAAKGDLVSVSLDLAKHSHQPDPVCKPPR